MATSPASSDFPRSAKYDSNWVHENSMGPDVLLLTEFLTQAMDFQPGMRILDLGCGRAISSIFLAREYDLQVWAADLWVPPSENWERIREAEVAGQVFPIYAESHALPFAHDFFDAIVSIDSYHYFGTDDLYLGNYFVHFVRPGGQIGIVVPGLVQEWPDGEVPVHLQPYWAFELNSLHSPDWWRNHWAKSGLVTVERSDLMSDGWQHWMDSVLALAQIGTVPGCEEEAEMLRVDDGRNLGFTRMIARRNPASPEL